MLPWDAGQSGIHPPLASLPEEGPLASRARGPSSGKGGKLAGLPEEGIFPRLLTAPGTVHAEMIVTGTRRERGSVGRSTVPTGQSRASHHGYRCAQVQDSGNIESHWIGVRGTDPLGGSMLDVLAVCPRTPCDRNILLLALLLLTAFLLGPFLVLILVLSTLSFFNPAPFPSFPAPPALPPPPVPFTPFVPPAPPFCATAPLPPASFLAIFLTGFTALAAALPAALPLTDATKDDEFVFRLHDPRIFWCVPNNLEGQPSANDPARGLRLGFACSVLFVVHAGGGGGGGGGGLLPAERNQG